MNAWRNEDVRHRVGVKENISDVDHVVRRSGDQLTESVYVCEMKGRRDRGRPCMRWLGGVQKAYNARSLNQSDVELLCMDRD